MQMMKRMWVTMTDEDRAAVGSWIPIVLSDGLLNVELIGQSHLVPLRACSTDNTDIWAFGFFGQIEPVSWDLTRNTNQ